MITDKRARIVLCAVLLVAVVLALVSCEETKEDLSALDVITDNANGNNDGADDDSASVGYYRIVLSGNCSSEVSSAAHGIKIALEQATGVDCGVTYDAQQAPDRSDVIEILIGNTTRNSSRVAFEGLRTDDYVCKWVEGSIVIGGISNSATLTALERFIDEILPYATPSGVMSAEQEFCYSHNYALDSVKLCGFEISDYSIVSSEQTLEYALALADDIAQKSGHILSAKQGKAKDTVKEIVLLVDSECDANAYIEYDSEDVVLRAKDAYGVSVALAKLFDQLLESGEKTVSLDIRAQISIPYMLPEIRVMNVVEDLGASESDIDGINEIISRIRNDLPDAVVLENIDNGVIDMMLYGLPANYMLVRSEITDTCGVAVFYRLETVEVSLLAGLTEGGSSALKFRLSHIASGEEYQIVLLSGEAYADADVLNDALVNNVSDANNSMVIVLTPDNQSDISSAELSVRYSSLVTLYRSEYRTALLSGRAVSVDETSLNYSESQNVAFVEFVLGKTCFMGISEYIQ